MNRTHVIESSIDGRFFGWSGSTVFKLANGQVWEQDTPSRTYHFAYRPYLRITEIDDTHLMQVDGIGSIRVRRVCEFTESQIDGAFHGWDGRTVFPIVNGQVWQQAAYAYRYRYAYRPDVLIYRSKGGWRLEVDGVDQTVQVSRIKCCSGTAYL